MAHVHCMVIVCMLKKINHEEGVICNMYVICLSNHFTCKYKCFGMVCLIFTSKTEVKQQPEVGNSKSAPINIYLNKQEFNSSFQHF